MQRLTEISKIFSDINRVRMVALIQREKEVCVCEICDTLELSQPLVSRYLKQMREQGVLQAEQRGKWMIYSLENSPDSLLGCWLEQIRNFHHLIPARIRCNML